MATLATNDDGTGKSKVFIASERKIIINALPPYLKNNISFVRVIHGIGLIKGNCWGYNIHE